MYLVFHPCCISTIGGAVRAILLHGRAIEERKIHPDLAAAMTVAVAVAIRIRTATMC